MERLIEHPIENYNTILVSSGAPWASYAYGKIFIIFIKFAFTFYDKLIQYLFVLNQKAYL